MQSYDQGQLNREELQELLGIGRSRFLVMLKDYCRDPVGFNIAYQRATPARLSADVEVEMAQALLREKEIVEDPNLPISGYNYTAIKDRLAAKGISISVTTIIKQAKQMDCYKPRKKRKTHDREVLTVSIGALIQHDASLHQWSPYAQEKWYLITSIDDYSRKLLFADFFPKETTWTHIRATQAVLQQYGLPLRYYVDSLRVFRFVQGRDSFWRKHILETDDVDTQWAKMMRLLGIDVVHALSPQAKGKVERPYRWLQDRIVRTCVYENLSTMEEVRSVLKAEVDRYNNRQVHSTTGEIPNIRFQKARKEGNSLFRKFTIPKPYRSPKDVFCLRTSRMVNGYRRISLFKHQIEVPNMPLREDVDVHLVPDETKQLMHIRIWWNDKMVHSISLPLQGFRVHFSSFPNTIIQSLCRQNRWF
jgi:hypothetical protein